MRNFYIGRNVLDNNAYKLSFGGDVGFSFANLFFATALSAIALYCTRCCCSTNWKSMRKNGINRTQLFLNSILITGMWLLSTAFTAGMVSPNESNTNDDDCPNADDDCGGAGVDMSEAEARKTTGCMGVFIAGVALTTVAMCMSKAIRKATMKAAEELPTVTHPDDSLTVSKALKTSPAGQQPATNGAYSAF